MVGFLLFVVGLLLGLIGTGAIIGWVIGEYMSDRLDKMEEVIEAATNALEKLENSVNE